MRALKLLYECVLPFLIHIKDCKSEAKRTCTVLKTNGPKLRLHLFQSRADTECYVMLRSIKETEIKKSIKTL